MNNPKTVILSLACAIVLAGEILRAGTLVEVTESEAKDLLRRGKAVLHNYDPDADGEVFASGTQETELHPVIAEFQQDRADQHAARTAAIAAATDAASAAGQPVVEAARTAILASTTQDGPQDAASAAPVVAVTSPAPEDDKAQQTPRRAARPRGTDRTA